MGEGLIWEEIQKKYPDQWVGLAEISWKDEANIESAVVKYADKTKDELLMMQINGEIFRCYIIPDHVFQLGVVGYLHGTSEYSLAFRKNKVNIL